MNQPDEALCPTQTRETIDLYVSHGCEPGSFVQAVLENDLAGALGKADPINLGNLRHVMAYVYNCISVNSWGSRKIVEDWKEKKRGEHNGDAKTLSE